MVFGKKKGKNKNDGGSRLYIRVAPALVPPAVFTAVPRTPPPVYEPIVLRPIDTYGTLSRTVVGPSPNENDTYCNNANEDSGDSFDETEREEPDLESTDRQYHGTAERRSTRPLSSSAERGTRHLSWSGERNGRQPVSILGPPRGFTDYDRDDTDDEYVPNPRRSESLGSTGGRRVSESLGSTGGGRRITADAGSDIDELDAVVVASQSRSLGAASLRSSGGGLGYNETGGSGGGESLGDVSQLSTNRSRNAYDDRRSPRSDGSRERTFIVPKVASGTYPISESQEFDTRSRTSLRYAELKEKNRALEERQARMEQQLKAQSGQFRQSRELALLASQRPGSKTPQEMGSMLIESQSLADQTMSGRDEMIDLLKERIRRMKEDMREICEENERLQQNNEFEGSPRSAEAQRRQIHDAMEERDTLKSLVVRLNAELDRYHRQTGKLSQADIDGSVGLPFRGPKPSWLVNTKCLAPLLVAYDERLNEQDKILRLYEQKIDEFSAKCVEIIKENERLHIRLEQTDVMGPISNTEWKALQEQCKLVLEENQLLMDQLNHQQNKENEAQKCHIQEVARLTQKLNVAEVERAQYKSEVEELQTRLESVKRKYEEILVDSRSRVSTEEHIKTVSALKQTLQDEKIKYSTEISDVTTNLKVVEAEKKCFVRDIDKSKEVIRILEAEIKSRAKTEKKSNRKIEMLQATINDMEAVAAKVKQYLATVLKAADMTAKERDCLVQSAKDQETDRLNDLRKFVIEAQGMSQLQDRIKLYSAKKKKKLDRMSHKLEEQGADFKLQREEYERELNHLRQLVRDRDELVNVVTGEKREVLEDLETMWQVASKDNQRMQEEIRRAGRRLQEHASLRARLPDDPDARNELDFIIQQCACEDERMSRKITVD